MKRLPPPPPALRVTLLKVQRTFTLRVRSFILFSFFLPACLLVCLLASCQPEPRNMVPSDETYIYSGSFRAIQEPFILVDGTEYPNQIGEAPIQITAEVQNDNLVFTIYGRDYGIYDVNLFVNHADCFELNGTEYLDIDTDEFGNEEVRVLFPEDFFKKCYMDDDLEKTVSFVLKAEKPVFTL